MHDVITHSADCMGLRERFVQWDKKLRLGGEWGKEKGAEMIQYNHLDGVFSVALDAE